jgi:hypothetical protein
MIYENTCEGMPKMQKFQKALGLVRPDLLPGEQIFSGITPHFTFPRKFRRSRLKKISILFPNTLSLLDLAQANYFIPFPKAEEGAGSLTMSSWTRSRRSGNWSSAL